MGRYYLLLGLFFFSISIHSQVITGFDNEEKNMLLLRALPDTTQLNDYYDSLYNQLNTKLLTGYIISTYNEPVPNTLIKYSFSENNFDTIRSDSIGRFYIRIDESSTDKIHIQIRDKKYQQFDTTLTETIIPKNHLPVILTPRYEIALRGRLYVGSLATENVDVTIIHKSDTTNLTTRDCYVDDENYWNCLYRGMFMHIINFDDPDDTVKMTFNKPGFIEKSIAIKVSDYDGSVLPVKLEYSDLLNIFPTHNIAMKYAPPFTDAWSVALNYTHILQIGNFNRLALGFEAIMLSTEVQTETPTFPYVNSSDSTFIVGYSDTTYNTGMFTPQFTFWITDPQLRFISVYAGVGFPFTIPNNKFYIQPYLGGRIYLDLNKALIIEAKYVNYEIDVVKYEFNPYGPTTRTANSQTFNQLLLNLGLQVSF